MNYVKEVAKLLGVELNEEFELLGDPDTKYRLTEADDSDHCVEAKYKDESWHRLYRYGNYANLEDLICGRYTIKKSPFKPKIGDFYYVPIKYNGELHVSDYRWKGLVRDLAFWGAGLCFRTAEEAKVAGIERAKEILEELNE